jgi:hypothetical protein
VGDSDWWKFLLALAALMLVSALVVNVVSSDDWARVTSFILTLVGVILGAVGVFAQRQTTW